MERCKVLLEKRPSLTEKVKLFFIFSLFKGTVTWFLDHLSVALIS